MPTNDNALLFVTLYTKISYYFVIEIKPMISKCIEILFKLFFLTPTYTKSGIAHTFTWLSDLLNLYQFRTFTKVYFRATKFGIWPWYQKMRRHKHESISQSHCLKFNTWLRFVTFLWQYNNVTMLTFLPPPMCIF